VWRLADVLFRNTGSVATAELFDGSTMLRIALCLPVLNLPPSSAFLGGIPPLAAFVLSSFLSSLRIIEDLVGFK